MTKRASSGAFVLLSALAAILSCKKPAPGPADAAAEAGAIVGIDASATIVVRTDAPIDAGPRIVSLAEAMPMPDAPSWNGYYKCGKTRLKITHFESTVTGHASSDAEEKTYTCTITGDTCIGTETDISHGAKAKGATSKSRKLTMRRDSLGAIHYTAEGTAQQTCPKL